MEMEEPVLGAELVVGAVVPVPVGVDSVEVPGEAQAVEEEAPEQEEGGVVGAVRALAAAVEAVEVGVVVEA